MPSLDQGDQHLVQVLRAHMGQLYAAALLAAFAAVLTRLVPEGSPGWGLLRVALAGCLITQAMVATGVPGRAGLARALADIPGFRGADHRVHRDRVLGLRQAGLSPPWVSAWAWLSAAAHVLVLCTLAQRGTFAADGIIAGLVPITTVIWILALAATLPRSRRAAVTAAFETGG